MGPTSFAVNQGYLLSLCFMRIFIFKSEFNLFICIVLVLFRDFMIWNMCVGFKLDVEMFPIGIFTLIHFSG